MARFLSTSYWLSPDADGDEYELAAAELRRGVEYDAFWEDEEEEEEEEEDVVVVVGIN